MSFYANHFNGIRISGQYFGDAPKQFFGLIVKVGPTGFKKGGIGHAQQDNAVALIGNAQLLGKAVLDDVIIYGFNETVESIVDRHHVLRLGGSGRVIG